MTSLAVDVAPETQPELVDRLLRALPSWFGIETSIVEYVDAARRLPTLVASVDGSPVGVLLYERHFPATAEIHLMAVAAAGLIMLDCVPAPAPVAGRVVWEASSGRAALMIMQGCAQWPGNLHDHRQGRDQRSGSAPSSRPVVPPERQPNRR
jgi:hypothetical protein